MIKFSNGHSFDFGCASGALAFDGHGWWYDRPAIWAGLLRPQEFTVITKSLTYFSAKGNYRWWCPWRSIWPIRGGLVNCVAFTKGYQEWLKNDYPKLTGKVIASIMPSTVNEAMLMALHLSESARRIVGIQVNVSCPNVARDHSVEHICNIVRAVVKNTHHPVIVKLSWQDDCLAICKELDGEVEAFELINTVDFDIVFPDKKSPLTRYGLMGGVSGSEIKIYARDALVQTKDIKTPRISGGGIDSLNEVFIREAMGATGFTFGTLFMYQPWEPNRIINKYRNYYGYIWS